MEAAGQAMERANLDYDSIESRYLALVRLSSSVSSVSSWEGLASLIGDVLRMIGAQASLRLWGTTPDGFSILARNPSDAEFPPIGQGELRAAAERRTASTRADGRLLLGLHASGVSMGVLEVAGARDQGDLLAHAAPMVASAMGLLAVQGVGYASLKPMSVEAASDAASVMSAFAKQARRLLDHDRLSAYLLTPNRRAFERFAVATSPIITGEGVVIPFEDVGLRYIVITNRPLVSEDLSSDPRIVGREDRVIARAGFRGLLSVPLRREGRPIGVLNFVSKTPGFYRDEDIPIAQQIADQVGVFLENLRRQRQMRAVVMQEAVERERARLSRDLFDTVAQAVPNINALAVDLRDRVAAVDAQAAEDAERIMEISNRELADIRRAIIGMSPRALDGRRLEDVLESSLAQFMEATGIKTTWSIKGDTSSLPAAVEQATYRVFQEALANVRFHSRADTLRVRLVVDGSLTLIIEDDGVGFDVEAADRERGLGIERMTERAGALGGSFSIESAPGDGSRACFEIPAVIDADASVSPSRAELESQSETEAGGVLRVFVGEPHSLVRAGVIRILEQAPAMRVVGEANTAEDVRRQVARFSPDVIVLDEQLEPEYSTKLIGDLKSISGNSSVLVMARNTVDGVSEFLEAGGAGIIHKEAEAGELIDAVRAVASGARLVAGTERPAEQRENGAAPLSRREREILALVASGQTNAEIAEALFFATKTVERHVATIVGKLGARNRAHAAALAVSQKIIDVGER